MLPHCPYAIFDLDGTLIDSIPFWNDIGQDYLISQGKIPEEHLEQRILAMTLEESADYFRRSYGISKDIPTIISEVYEMMETHYRLDIPAKPGACDYLRSLKNQGVSMALCSTSSPELIRTVLTRLGILSLFDAVVSCQEVGTGKHSPAAYLYCLERLGVRDPALCMVYEDAAFAMETARSCGLSVTGVYDPGCEKTPEEVLALCDDYIRDFRDLL